MKTGDAVKVIGEVLDHFSANDLYPEHAWAFCDDMSSLGLDHTSPDKTKFWLDLNRDGTVSIFWRPAGSLPGKSIIFRQAEPVAASNQADSEAQMKLQLAAERERVAKMVERLDPYDGRGGLLDDVAAAIRGMK